MQQFKTYIFRLYPDRDQKKKLNSFLGTTRKFYHYIKINKILKENDVVFLENLKTKEMIEKGQYGLAKYISNSNFSNIIDKFKYKAKILGKKVYQVVLTFLVVKYAFRVVQRMKGLKNLNVRKLKCHKYHSLNERDINASLNILVEGTNLYFKDLDKEMKLCLKNLERELKLMLYGNRRKCYK